MKKALLPLLLIVVAILAFAAVGYWYNQRYGAEGPFESQHYHGDGHDHSQDLPPPAQEPDHHAHDHEH